VLLAAPGVAVWAPAAAERAAVGLSASPTNDYVNVTATSSFSFVPSTFTVYPGANVHLRVIQAANFLHTFTLSSVANTTVPSVGWFSTHTPLVNISLGTVPKTFFANFTAPAVGRYEYVCEQHFPQMTGNMTSTTAQPPPGPMPFMLTGLDYALIGIGVVALLVVVGVLLGVRRRKHEEKLYGPPPPS
jgi:plastocyanin